MLTGLWSFFKFIVFLLLLAALFHSLISHLMVWVSIRNQQLQNEPNVKMPWRTLLRNLFLETCYTFSYLILLPFVPLFQDKKISSKDQENTPPFLLIHGYLHNSSDWWWFRQQLQSIKGMGPIFTLNLLPHDKSIEEHAKLLEKKVERIKELTFSEHIILIGHSRGGLVASFYAEYLAEKNSVHSVITLGTPFSGTLLSAFGVTQNVKEMTLNAPLLTQLKEDIQHSSTPYYHVGSKVDNLIVPWDSACPWTLRNIKNTLILDDLGHLSLLFSSRVIKQIVGWILKENI